MSEPKARTVLINPRWSFKAHSAKNNMSAGEQWSVEEINGIWPKLNAMIDKDATIFLMVSPTQMALGGHIKATEGWGKFTPRSIHMWHVINSRGSGRSLYDDNLFPCVVLRSPSRYYKKEGQGVANRLKPIDESKDMLADTNLIFDAPMRGMGASYGKEVYDHVEDIGHGPYLQVFSRKCVDKHLPDHWSLYEPTKPKIRNIK